MEEKKKVEGVVINSENVQPFTSEETELLERFYKEYVVPKTKELLLKNFDMKYYANKLFDKFDFSLMVYWAVVRDCKVVPNSEKGEGYVLWRVLPSDVAPTLKALTKNKRNYIFTINYVKHLEPILWETKTIRVPIKEITEFAKEYANEIDTLEKKYTNCGIA